MSEQDKKFTVDQINLAYLIGVLNVSGMDGLHKELQRLKDIGKEPCEMFEILEEPEPQEQSSNDSEERPERGSMNLGTHIQLNSAWVSYTSKKYGSDKGQYAMAGAGEGLQAFYNRAMKTYSTLCITHKNDSLEDLWIQTLDRTFKEMESSEIKPE